ncbi:40S ribosomal protein mrp2, mitochondrial [Linnemannia elongata]|nr:40S ribosomal protein mrp2, mitochondrial [Linnemannia elongata]
MPRARIIRDMKARTHNTALPAKVRAQAQLQLNAFPRDARPTAIHNRCLETGRGRGVLRAFRLCRFQFRLKALEGELPGVRKSTWNKEAGSRGITETLINWEPLSSNRNPRHIDQRLPP